MSIKIPSQNDALSADIKEKALGLGFANAGIVTASPATTHAFYQDWLRGGHAGEMTYLHRHEDLKKDPRRVHPPTASLLVLTHPYPGWGDSPDNDDPLSGKVSRYARGRDYHEVLREKLETLAEWIADRAGRPIQHRSFVDSGPLMEREFATRAGLGWVGRNANLIHWQQGSWLFICELLLDLPLKPDEPARSHKPIGVEPIAVGQPTDKATALRESCGSCTACIQACPTQAIIADKTVDARRCISYLTIELKGPIPRALRAGMGEWVFGCDVCQEVCPWNRREPKLHEAAKTGMQALGGSAGDARPSLPALLALDQPGFRARYRESPIWRTRRRGLQRNAAIVLGNRLRRLTIGSENRLRGLVEPSDDSPDCSSLDSVSPGGGSTGSVSPGGGSLDSVSPGGASLGSGKAESRVLDRLRVGTAALREALHGEEPLVRGAAAWALGHALGGGSGREALWEARQSAQWRNAILDIRAQAVRQLAGLVPDEPEPQVAEEMRLAMQAMEATNSQGEKGEQGRELDG